MNTEIHADAAERGPLFCGAVTDNVIWVAVADIKEDKLVLELGMKVLFELYQDKCIVGGCEVISA